MKSVFIFILGLALNLSADVGKLSKIVDGDTVKFNDVTCRFAYIDTPESKRNDRAKDKVENCSGLTLDTMIEAGKESAKHLVSLLEVGKSYKYDVISVDRYSRNVCVIWIDNKTMLNQLMVEDGYAVPYYEYIKDERIKREMKASYSSAKMNSRGLFNKYSSTLKCIE